MHFLICYLKSKKTKKSKNFQRISLYIPVVFFLPEHVIEGCCRGDKETLYQEEV